MARLLEQERLGDSIDRLYRAAWALCGSRHDAEDLVQETYVRVLAKPRMIERDTDLAYLLRALHNTFITDRQRRQRVVPVDDEILYARADERSATQPDEAAEAREVFAAISALNAKHRDVIVAVDVVGLSYKEAARALRVPKGTVMSRLFRARDAVAEALTHERTTRDPAPRSREPT